MGQLGDLSPEGSIAIGIFVGLLSTSVQSIGLTLQRKSHILEDEKAPNLVRRPPHRRRRWQLGMGMFIVSNLLGSTIQITTLPLPVLSTLQASGLVFNSICATLILGEPFTRWSLGGTILVCAGAVLIAIFGAIPEPAHNLDQLLLLLRRQPFILWMVGQGLLVAIILVAASSLSRFSISSSPKIRLLRGLAFGCISGILSAHSLLVAKVAVELLVRTIVDHKNQFDRWQSWTILLSLVTLALTQLYFLHCGLKLVSTSVLYPLVFCIYNIIAILDGLIYFHQTSLLTPLAASLIALGTAILLSGVLALSWRLNDEQSQPAVTSSALAPGLGLVEDTEDEDYDELSTPDEEASIGLAHERLLSEEPMTPTSKLDVVLGATKGVRRVVRLAEESEIWEELDDATKIRSAPSRLPRRASTRQYFDSVHGESEEPSESTPLIRSGSFARRKRRKSTGFHGFTARPSPRNPEPRGILGKLFGKTWLSKWLEPPTEPAGSDPGPGGTAH